MTSTDDLHRNYKMSDAELCMFTSNLVNDMTRDLSDLASFGVTAANITALRAMGDAFENLPTDIELEALAMEATVLKNEILIPLKESIRSMALRVELKWGVDSTKYKALMITGMNNLSDVDLIFVARRVIRLMTSYLPDLTAEGLTQAMIDDFKLIIDSFEEAKNDQHDKNYTRYDASKDRMNAGNALYDKVVYYCEIGKRVYVSTDPVKYNCYVIYSPGPGGLAVPENLAFSYETNVFSWDAVPKATAYQLEMNTGSGFNEIYFGADTAFAYTPADGKTVYRVRAHNAGGFGNFSDNYELWYYDVLPAPNNLAVNISPTDPNVVQLNWDAVPSADSYTVYSSKVGIGQPAGLFMGHIADIPNYFEDDVALNYRYYYKVIAHCWGKSSGYSTTVYIDVPNA